MTSYIRAKTLCVHVVDNINYIGCNYGMCYFACVKGWCWRVKIIKHKRTVHIIVHGVIFLMWWSKLTYFIIIILASLWCLLCMQFLEVVITLICDQCSKGWHMGCLPLLLEEVLVKKWFCLWFTSSLDAMQHLKCFMSFVLYVCG